ncbi:MAG: flavodoxin-dependent (E)-4-hydroxy-3-methylbut-2-enyl-diphosphate synthase [Candidatus Omnitrophica bacterium]|nr:flavodoxin-dependent (E)-4-hydroxy-3-methylbut-2-enyl-diphosphate synthase [Candidatus Omnitrophota bacterium]
MSRKVNVGKVSLGGRSPVRIVGMLKTPSKEIKKLVKEAQLLEREGAEIIRIAFKEKKDAQIAKILKREITTPLVADIHFNWKLALLAMDAGLEGIRLNPLNIYKKNKIKEIITEAKNRKVAVRVGVNSGGFKKEFNSPLNLAREMTKIASDYVKILEEEGFSDIIVSLKTSEVRSTVLANRLFSQRFNYPLQLGVTATGPYLEGIVKSSLGVGILLFQGLGDALRVSLTESSREEIRVAKRILQFLGLRNFFPEIISCPTCGRCKVDLIEIVEKFKKEIEKIDGIKLPVKIAIMGCIVNGPGEAYQADIGLAFGEKRGAIFKKNRIIKITKENQAIKDLLEKVRNAL